MTPFSKPLSPSIHNNIKQTFQILPTNTPTRFRLSNGIFTFQRLSIQFLGDYTSFISTLARFFKVQYKIVKKNMFILM